MILTGHRMTGRCWLVAVLLAILGFPAFSADPLPPADARITLDDLLATEGAADAAVSPSGKYIAAVLRRPDSDLLVLIDAATGESKGLTRVGRHNVSPRHDSHITSVYWKTESRLLIGVVITLTPGAGAARDSDLRHLGFRLFGVDRDGGNFVRMLQGNDESELDWAFDLGSIRSFLPRDPDNILMLIDGMNGRSLFKVNVHTGAGAVVEPAGQNIIDWWLDLDGKPVVRVDVSRGFIRFYRQENGDKWKQYHKVRLRELEEHDEYEPLGPSDQAGKFYVLARPEGAQRRGIYLYDLEKESFGPPVAENPEFDIVAGFISRDGKHVQRYCYLAHVQICETADARLNAHLNAVRRFFDNSANVYVADSSDDNETLLLYVEGPSSPPAYFYYELGRKHIQSVGLSNDALANKALPTATLVEYQSRDDVALTGYFTRPAGAANATRLPLVMFPHGGPELRDHLTFDLYVQYFAALGYAVFQPNFRGSDGFGRDFAEGGYGQWGRRMQDDISDAVALLVAQKAVDPARVCIVGASYGGYAALAGAAFTPGHYKCAVSIAGPSDLAEYLKSRRRKFGADSEVYAYWMRTIGDPKADSERIAATSPALHVDRIQAPILLIHGDADDIVPYEQSKLMKKVLDKSGRKTELITLEDEGHSYWSSEHERQTLEATGRFLVEHLGAGFGQSVENSP